MKQIIYILSILISASLFLTSCEDDNYSEPNSGISGQFIDADTSEPVPMPVQGHGNSVKVRMYEKDRFYSGGSDHSTMPVDFYVQMDGKYSNTWMFSNDYLITTEQNNFYPIDTISISLASGTTSNHNIMVTPYSRIKIVKAEIEEAASGGVISKRELKVTYKIDRSRDDYKIESTFLAWHISPYIDNASGNSSGKISQDYRTVIDTDLLNTELTYTFDLLNDDALNNPANLAIIKGNGNRIFVRIGVFTNGKANYSTVSPVSID